MDLSLDAASALPTPEEQAHKEREALDKLRQFVLLHDGVWEDGWSCRMRFRVTARRNGKMGRTTDNYYYSPCGQSFRNYRQVSEFLGLSVAREAVRGKPGPKAAKRAAALPASPSSGSSSGTVDFGIGAAGFSWRRVGHAACSSASSLNGAVSGPTSDDCAASAPPPPPAKKARTKGSVAARRSPVPAPRLAPAPGFEALAPLFLG